MNHLRISTRLALLIGAMSLLLIGIGSSASPDSRSRSSGNAIARLISSLSLLTTASGILAGPTMPYHCTAVNPEKPNSSKVGTSGKTA